MLQSARQRDFVMAGWLLWQRLSALFGLSSFAELSLREAARRRSALQECSYRKRAKVRSILRTRLPRVAWHSTIRHMVHLLEWYFAFEVSRWSQDASRPGFCTSGPERYSQRCKRACLDLDCLATGPELPADSMFPATCLYQLF